MIVGQESFTFTISALTVLSQHAQPITCAVEQTK